MDYDDCKARQLDAATVKAVRFRELRSALLKTIRSAAEGSFR